MKSPMCTRIVWVLTIALMLRLPGRLALAQDEFSVNDAGETSYLVRDWVTCFVFALGGLAGILSIFFRRALSGVLFFLACFFLGLEPLTDLLVFHLLLKDASEGTWAKMVIAANVITTLGVLLGIICFIAAVLMAREKHASGAPVVVPPPTGGH